MAASGDLILLAWSDLVGITRGRAVPTRAYAGRRKTGINWAMAGHALTPFEDIADNPWGSMGEVHMTPDHRTLVHVDLWDDLPALSFVLCDGLTTDGKAWDSCTRGFLNAALADLEKEAGLCIYASPELEFQLIGEDLPCTTPFSIEAFRIAPKFAARCVAALHQAGTEPEAYEPEFGVNQFEVSCRPTIGVAAADRMVTVKEVIREVARRSGYQASFTPKIAPDRPGNGAHIHFSLQTPDGRPATHDPNLPGGLTKKAASFAAGVVRHMPAIIAITAPSPPSYFRLGPHHWSAGYACLGTTNREAALRICIPPKGSAERTRRLYNLEFRPADATANPYLTLGALVRAGLQGIRERLPLPPLINEDPHDMGAERRRKLGIATLPAALPEALDAMANDRTVRGWFSDNLWNAYRSVKRKEIDLCRDVSVETICERYARVY